MQKKTWTQLILIGLCATISMQIKAERLIEREIPLMTSAPVIDGDLSEWKDVAHFDLLPPSWKHKYDHSARVWLAWDETNVYVAIKVYDQKIVNDNDPAKGLYMGDQVRLRISAQPEAQGVNFGEADREIFVAPTSAAGTPACTMKVGEGSHQIVGTEKDGLTWAVATHERGYTVEYAIPVSVLGVDKLEKGTDALAYNLAVYDRDTASADEWKQTHIRISSSSVKKQPREWPALRLSEKVLILEEN